MMEKVSRFSLVLLTFALFFSHCLSSSGESSDPQTDLDALGPQGENVCIDQTPENKTVNVTYLESYEAKEMTWCFKIPPRCPVWRTKLVTRYKAKNITRIVNHHRCCNGYEQTDGKCLPVCTASCLHGKCVEPEVCSCQPGFSGKDCGEVGCPGGNWGPDCSQACSCSNGGRCEPNTGVCECLPGWSGLLCESKCDREHFGRNCSQQCDCEAGNRCHHVTGDCSPCTSGTYGLHCLNNCSCTANGTALCYHENGNCFCKPNFYGRTCEMYCPFGYLDGTCHTEPMAAGFCSCASDLYRCDKDKGCVCKDGFDCEGGTHFIDFASLRAATGDESSSKTTYISIIATVLLLALIVTILFVVYYRRRMRRMQKDLEHRSVRYIENSVHNHHHEVKKNELVISNTDALGGAEVEPREMAPNNVANVVNNVRNAEKNVNIDKFKLGEDQLGQEDEGAASTSRGASGSADVNLFQEPSPSKEKNNERLADLYRKANKANVDSAMSHTREVEDNHENQGLESDDDMEPKVAMGLKRKNTRDF